MNFEAEIESLKARVAKLEARQRTPKANGDWLAALKVDPLYAHINFDAELEKIARWMLLPKNVNRQVTRRFLINWLNKVDQPVALPHVKARPPAPPPKTDPIARGQWKLAYGDPRQYGYD